MKTCEKCGNPVPDEKAFCPNCGAAMTAERARTPDYVSEEMGPTMYGYDAPSKNPAAQKPLPPPVEAAAEKRVEPPAAKPVKAELSREPSASKSLPSELGAEREAARSAQAKAPAVNSNRTLHLILGASAVLFALSILLVVILYVTGKL